MWRRRVRPEVGENMVVNAQAVPVETPTAITKSDLIKLNEKNGMTRLHEAVKTETPNLENIKNLISMAESFEIKDKFLNMKTSDEKGMTALHYAVEKSNNEIVKILVDKMDNNGLNIQDNHGDTALHTAFTQRLFYRSRKESRDKQEYIELLKKILK